MQERSDIQFFIGAVSTSLIGLASPAIAQDETPVIETRALYTDVIPGTTTPFDSIDSFALLENGDIFFDAGGRRGTDDAKGLFKVVPTGEQSTIGTVGVAPFADAIGVPGLDYAVNNQGFGALDGGLDQHLFEFDAVLGTGPDQVTFGDDFADINLPSGVTGVNETGHFDGRLRPAGLEVAESNHLYFHMAFVNDDPQLSRGLGLFESSSSGVLSNIVYAGDPVPGLADFTFAILGELEASSSGNAYFWSRYDGPFGVINLGNDEAYWRFSSGNLSLVIREGDRAPGFAENSFIFNPSIVPGSGDQVLLDASLNDGVGNISHALWLGADASDFESFVQSSSSNLATATKIGSESVTMYFRDIRAFQPTIATNGDIYFVAFGDVGSTQTDPNAPAAYAGIWRRDFLSEEISLHVQETDTFDDFVIHDVNEAGRLAFTARLSDGSVRRGLWLVEKDQALRNIIETGDDLEGLEIQAFDMDNIQVNDAGQLAFIAEFGQGVNVDLEGVFVATLSVTEPSDSFLWTGDAGDDDWHKPLNWDDEETGEDAVVGPGDKEGEERATISGESVAIRDRAVHLNSLFATGSLEVSENLTTDEVSAMENLTLNADLIGNSEISLSGSSKWNSGTILSFFAETPFTILNEAELRLVSAANGGSNDLELSGVLNVRGTVIQEENMDLSLVQAEREFVTDHGFLVVRETGQYVMDGGAIVVDPESIGTIIVEGLFASFGRGGPPAIIRGGVLSIEGGDLTVPTGELFTESEVDLKGGTINVDSNATLVLRPPFDDDPDEPGVQVIENFEIEGGGEVKAERVIITLGDARTLTTNMDSETGVMEVSEGSSVVGEGILKNTGRIQFKEAEVGSKIVNEGTLIVDGEAEVTHLELITRGVLENDAFVSVRGSLQMDTNGVSHEEVIVNRGRFEMDSSSEVVEQTGFVSFKNESEGRIVKTGDGVAEMFVYIENEGSISVEEGSLELFDGVLFGSETNAIGSPSTLNISSGAQMVFRSSLPFERSEYRFRKDYEFVGDGELIMDQVDFIINPDRTVTNRAALVEIVDTETPFDIEGNLVNEDGSMLFTGSSEKVEISVLGNLVNGELGFIGVESGLEIVISRESSTLLNQGEIEVIGGPFDVSNALEFPEDSLFTNEGTVTLSGGGPSNNYHSIFWTDFHMGRKGKVHLKEYAKLTLLGFASTGTIEYLDFPVSHFVPIKGEWEVEAGSELSIPSDDPRMFAIGEDASVIIHGIPGDAGVPDGEFGGLSNTIDNFSNDGRLTLFGVTNLAEGNFINTRLMFCDPARFEIPDSSLFKNSGSVSGNVVIVGNVVNEGFIAPGTSPGTFEVEGDFTQEENGELGMELGGTEPGSEYDQLVVSGTATLAGCLRLMCLDEAFPENGAAFTPIVATAITGQFDEIVIDVPSGRQLFDVEIEATGVTASARTLEVTTFDAWQSGVFSTEEQADPNISGLMADPDGDGVVNLLEYALDGNPKVITPDPVSVLLETDANGVPESVTVDFPWANGVTDVAFEIEYSTDLANWVTLIPSNTNSEEAGLVSLITLSSEIETQAGDPVFVRLIVSKI